MDTKLILPLMMYGKLRGMWHRKGMPTMKQTIVGYTTFKTGKRKGKKKPIYEWIPTKTISKGFYPSANAIFMTVNGGNRLSPMAEKKLQEWKDIALVWQMRVGWRKREEPEKVIVQMTFYFPDYKARDTHNAKKLLMDALEGVIHVNDMFMIDRTIDFGVDAEYPRIEIEVKPFEDAMDFTNPKKKGKKK